jgi:hypothetical protein
MNYKKAGTILITLGVTATVIYAVYSYKFLATVKELDEIKKSCSNCPMFQGLSEEESLKMSKNVHNLTKKELRRVYALDSTEERTEIETNEYNSLIKKWNFKNK